MHRSPTNQSYGSADQNISRPSSLEITNQPQYATAQKGDGPYPNGPVSTTTTHSQAYGRNYAPGQVQGPPAYSHQQAPPEYTPYDPASGQYNQQVG